MTKDDWQYLLWFGGVLSLFIVVVILEVWLLAVLFGVFVVLFIAHMALNLFSTLSRNNVLTLLKKVESSKDNNYVLAVESWDDDYSEWDAFCDTPIITDRLLNQIRVGCHKLRSNSMSFGESIDAPVTISKDAIEEIGKYIHELEKSI